MKAKAKRFVSEFGISEYNAEILIRNKSLADFFEKAIDDGKKVNVDAKAIANYIINKKPNIEKLEPAGLVKIIVGQSIVSQIDEVKLAETISTILKQNPQAVTNYKEGKVQIIGFLIGQIRKALPKAQDTEQIRNKLLKMIE